jgi:hypothetical protein
MNGQKCANCGYNNVKWGIYIFKLREIAGIYSRKNPTTKCNRDEYAI